MAPQTTLIYHITHSENLHGIVTGGALISQSLMKEQNVDYCDIAHGTIQDRRARIRVPCDPGGCLHDYVPFYFAPRSPMLFAIHRGNVEGCTAGQSDIVYLVTNAQRVKEAGLAIAFTDGHGTMAMSEFYNDLEDLDEIDWDVMAARYWADTEEDPDRKRRRQAEFLIYDRLPWILVDEIGTMNNSAFVAVQNIIKEADHKPPVNIRSNWYY